MAVNYTPELQPYKETGSFRFWCQKILPLVYDDSLSYYELLCKVVQYLNDVIENADGLYYDVQALRNAFNQLQNYVNNYFDNLNVQEEINNKLDQMVEDGTLSDIINQQIFDEIQNQIKNINENVFVYASNEAGWRVKRVRNSAECFNSFVRSFTPEAYVRSEITLGYLSDYLTKILPEPLTAFSITGTSDSYMGDLINTSIVNNSLVRYRWFLTDSNAGGGTSITIAERLNVVGIRATPPTIPENPIGAKRTEAVAIAKSYYDSVAAGRNWAYGPNFVTYAASNVVNNGYGYGMMECDSLVAMVMMGIPYDLSPYATTTPSFTYDFTDITENPNGYTWCLPWKYDSTLGRKVTYTGGQNWYCWYNSLVFNDPDNIAAGDIIIFTQFESEYFDGISHIGIIDIQVENNVNVPYIYHFTAREGLSSPMAYEKLSDMMSAAGYTFDNVYFARPDYN